MNKIFKGILWVVAALAIVGGAAAAWLIYPGTPGNAGSLDFKGYVILPGEAFLTVLDYLNVSEKRLFVTDESSGSVYKIALRDELLPGAADIAVFASVPATHGVLIDPATQLAFVTRSEANTVDAFDPTNMQPLKRIPVADDPDGIFYDPFHKLIYVASGDAKLATLIDPATQAVISTIPLGGKAEFAVFDSQTNLMYQNLKDTNSMVALDLGKRAIVETLALQNCRGPSGMAIDEPNRRLFIVCSSNSVLEIVDLNKKQEIASFPIGGAPDSVAFDAGLHRIYTTGKSGVLVVLQQEGPDSYHEIDSIKLHYGAHTLAVDPATHWVYVGYAALAVRARVAVFAPRPQ
jgi:DNA-binding beta-propeller fold protein YncE